MKRVLLASLMATFVASMFVTSAQAQIIPESSHILMWRDEFGDPLDAYVEAEAGETITVFLEINSNFGNWNPANQVNLGMWWDTAVIEPNDGVSAASGPDANYAYDPDVDSLHTGQYWYPLDEESYSVAHYTNAYTEDLTGGASYTYPGLRLIGWDIPIRADAVLGTTTVGAQYQAWYWGNPSFDTALDGAENEFALHINVLPPSSACVIGDADCDGYVDVGNDIFAAFGNFTGPGSYGMTRIQGDVQGNPQGATTNLDPHDGDVDVSDIITMFSNFTGPAPPEDGAGGLVAAEALDSAIPDLIYDASTGEVLLDLDSAVGFTGYVLNSANGFITGNHTPFMAGVTTTLPYELAEATFGTPAGPYPKSIGQVFPSGMDMTALSAFLTGNQVSRGNNQPIVPFDLVIVNPVSSGVPEPAAVVMGIMALAGLATVAYRRRRNA